MDLARVNVATVGVFSWVSLEPEEGVYTFDWLDEVMDTLHKNGKFAVMATPSAAPPAWLSKKYPQTLRVGPDRVPMLHGNRVNYDWSSTIYREKVREMASILAERYGNHPALLMWHVSNEYGGMSYSEASRQAFIQWLKNKFGGSLDALNDAYWTRFWGHTYTEWDQIEIPGPPYGETAIQGLTLDWNRFTSDEIVSFFMNESEPLRRITPNIPITTNLMGFYGGLDAWRMAPHVDVVAWDSYPQFSQEPMSERSWAKVGMVHDLYRSLKGGKPFLLMECTPSSSNWYPYMNLKSPGMHRLEGIQAVAHGSDSVMYFQWRQCRGGQEKFHGAVVGVGQGENSRIFKDVATVGEDLEYLKGVVGGVTESDIALIYDWEVAWAIDGACGPIQKDKGYFATCLDHYLPLWKAGFSVDILNSDADLSGYKLVIAPMLYLLKLGVAERLKEFVGNGGTLVGTYMSGYVDENDLIFENGFLGPLRDLFGIVTEELDARYPSQTAEVVMGENDLEFEGIYQATTFCERIQVTSADVLGHYGNVWYMFEPAVTLNRFGNGEALYVASRNDEAFTSNLLHKLIERLQIEPATPFQLPDGVSATKRVSEDGTYLFLLNTTEHSHWIALPEEYIEALNNQPVSGSLEIGPFGVAVLKVAT